MFLLHFRNDLDILYSDVDKLPSDLRVDLEFEFGFDCSSEQVLYTEPWEKMNVDKLSPVVCFTSKNDYWNCREEFGKFIYSCLPMDVHLSVQLSSTEYYTCSVYF